MIGQLKVLLIHFHLKTPRKMFAVQSPLVHIVSYNNQAYDNQDFNQNRF